LQKQPIQSSIHLVIQIEKCASPSNSLFMWFCNRKISWTTF